MSAVCKRTLSQYIHNLSAGVQPVIVATVAVIGACGTPGFGSSQVTLNCVGSTCPTYDPEFLFVLHTCSLPHSITDVTCYLSVLLLTGGLYGCDRGVFPLTGNVSASITTPVANVATVFFTLPAFTTNGTVALNLTVSPLRLQPYLTPPLDTRADAYW